MNDPILAPNLWGNQLEEIGLFEPVAKLGAEENRERLDVNEEAIAGIEPPAIGSEPASKTFCIVLGGMWRVDFDRSDGREPGEGKISAGLR